MQFFASAGPLPPPQILQAYNAIIPGAAKEMHDLVIAKARHDMEMERNAMGAQAQDQQAARAQFKRGQYLTFLLALAVIGWGGTCVLKSHDWAGATIIVGTLAGLVLAFLRGRKATGSPEEQHEVETPRNPPPS
ncbi:MAG TPA: DUF2335 domain-containing protein [Planctomycetota bacterium]|nr:DUF2335 domain-containing protein [Planctomycetota bacterium]